MKVEIWSDIACPYCYIGKRRFEMALEKFDGKENVEVIWRSFELDPNAELTYQENKYELLAKKYDQPLKWAELACDDMAKQGAEIGLNFDFDNNKPTNTFNAQRLIHLASESGKEQEVQNLLFESFFSKGELISKSDILLTIAAKAGLDKDKAEQVLNSDGYSAQVKEDEALAKELGIQSVPFFIIDEAYGMEGAQPVEHILTMLENVSNGVI
ncbi:DsbA family oxidoreductase [Psychrosphaera sp. F3M07]|uniref:DsbA family oxidoreductase n=1 Tax=Psychrosphaera aquimarina TaxID=2044854 RepID=A0ABU3R029_9GAMM|nr:MULTISPECIES: DsbA family oxidoreductase [Psychrosphaera]MBU2917212.1 DsbA family oxidoreductase [Psychrosphaera sp. F3M07]MDU0113046.1 DsbA family oxidoreductase [Psychrosphaera aquimarina]